MDDSRPIDDSSQIEPITTPIPTEIWIEILSRLPVKSLIIFTTVCKLWYSLITSPSFIKGHFKQTLLISDDKNEKPSEYICIIPKRSMEFGKTVCSLLSEKEDSFVERENLVLPIYTPYSFFKIGNSCNGLICLNGESGCIHGRRVYLFNPAIRKLKLLPFSSFSTEMYECRKVSCKLGFGFCKDSNDFKVVRIHYTKDDDLRLLGSVPPAVEIYSLNNDSWRTVETNVPRVADHRSVSCGGYIHWLARSGAEADLDMIMSFDISKEVFREMALPGEFSSSPGRNVILLLLQGMLAMFRGPFNGHFEWVRRYEVWVMKDFGVTDSWTKQFSVATYGSVTRALGFTRSGKLVLHMSDCQLVLHDPVSQERTDLGFDESPYQVDTAYKESLQLFEGAEKPMKIDVLARIKLRLNIPMDFHLRMDSYRVWLHGNIVKVRIAVEVPAINYAIAKLRKRTWRKPPIVSIMIKPDPKPSLPDNASLLVLSAENYCVIVQLHQLDHIPKPLKDFLANPEICFFGINVRRLHEKFFRQFKLMDTAFELASFLASLQNTCHHICHKRSDVAQLAAQVGVTIDDPPSEITGIDWNAGAFSEDEIRYIVHDVCVSYLIAEKLLR